MKPAYPTIDMVEARTKWSFRRLPRDDWYDEVQIAARSGVVIQGVTRYRYKTSGMSGDEWRTSFVWRRRDGAGDLVDFDGHYADIHTACAALYAGVYGSHPDLHNLDCRWIDFLRKGHIVYRSSYDGRPLGMLALLGHLPWALIDARENGALPAVDKLDALPLCDQPGCSRLAVSIYRIVKDACGQCGTRKEMISHGRLAARKFCPVHLQRGDASLYDADDCYEVVVGPGPEASCGRDFEVEAQRIVLGEGGE